MKRLMLLIRRGAAERISQKVFYLLSAVIVLLFGLFYAVGYSIPYLLNPDLNAPLFTGAIISLILFLLLLAVAFATFGVGRSICLKGEDEQWNNRIPAKKITYAVVAGTFLLLLLTLLLGSDSDILINGQPYTDHFWLKISDMFIITGIVLLFVAMGAVVFGATRYYRKDKK